MLDKAKDAIFDLIDSVMTTRNASCIAEFSLSPLFRRKWSSTYEAIEDNRPNQNKLMRRLVYFRPKQPKQPFPITREDLLLQRELAAFRYG